MDNVIAAGPVVPKVDNVIHRVNHYPTDSLVCFVNTYPLDSDLSGGKRYPPFEQPGMVYTQILHVKRIKLSGK